MAVAHPTWSDDVEPLFAAPYWVEPGRRAAVAEGWHGCMTGFGVDLVSYDSVRQWAVTIYDHLASRAMPLTTDGSQFWPAPALETFRAWVNEGCRRDATAPIERSQTIPPPGPEPPPPRIRKDILAMTGAELDAYRARLEEVGATTLDLTNPWQFGGNLHTQWCLHYQEAFLLWHRANLLWFEHQLGMPIPYWDFMAADAPVDGRPGSGLPQPFKDLTYVHPGTGEVRPNPLRFAIAYGGKSKLCVAGPAPPDVDCRYVQRDPLLYTTGDDHRDEREQKVAMLRLFQEQVDMAMRWVTFSSPEGDPGYPWANLPTFHPPQPDKDYPHRTDFDGLLEQPHDNLHGWVGPDMADNSYTAFDPVFWSLHAGIDRVLEQWLRAHPAAQFTSNFPLRPFSGARAEGLAMTSPHAWVYTTIGDMARDSRALGFDFGPPAGAPAAPSAPVGEGPRLYVLFPEVRCIMDGYVADVYIDDAFAGRMTRLGMGVEDDKGRCVRDGVTRVLDVTATARALGLQAGSEVRPRLVVTHAATGRVAGPEEYGELPGFEPLCTWGSGLPPAAPPAPAARGGHACH